METLGSRLKALRRQRNLTQQKIADALGVSKTSVIYWEKDENVPKHESLIALARTLILKPKIILYDEPTTGLDPITSKEIVLLMNSIQKQYNTSSIIITHDVDCAKVIANRMILLIDGVNYIEGTFDELANSTDPKVQAFFK